MCLFLNILGKVVYFIKLTSIPHIKNYIIIYIQINTSAKDPNFVSVPMEILQFFQKEDIK